MYEAIAHTAKVAHGFTDRTRTPLSTVLLMIAPFGTKNVSLWQRANELEGRLCMSEKRTYDLNCPIAKSLDLMGDRWTILILRDLFIHNSRRYVELRDGLTGIPPTLLSQRLKDLVESGLVQQIDAPQKGRIAYELTARGRETQPILMALAQFGMPLISGRVNTSAWKAFAQRK